MKIAIHHRKDSYSTEWIEFCKLNNIDYLIVDGYASDIIDQVRGCDAFMWNWAQWHSRDVIFALKLIHSIEQMGIEVYPNVRSCMLFDDKLGQKYLFEGLDIPFIKSEVFFYKEDALKWINTVKFPIVFKLRGGSSSVNVKLVKTKSQAVKIIKKAFGRGFRPSDRLSDFKDRISLFLSEKTFKSFVHMLVGVVRIIYPRNHERMMKREKGYVYFQEFIPNRTYDIRVFVFGDRATAIKRLVRKNDFRASGSGAFIYDPSEIDEIYIKTAFKLNEKLKMQSVAFDFIMDDTGIKVVEICYANGEANWPGYWTRDAEFIPVEDYKMEYGIIENLIEKLKVKQENMAL